MPQKENSSGQREKQNKTKGRHQIEFNNADEKLIDSARDRTGDLVRVKHTW